MTKAEEKSKDRMDIDATSHMGLSSEGAVIVTPPREVYTRVKEEMK